MVDCVHSVRKFQPISASGHLWYRIVMLTTKSNVNVSLSKGISTNVFERSNVFCMSQSTIGCFAIESIRQCCHASNIDELGAPGIEAYARTFALTCMAWKSVGIKRVCNPAFTGLTHTQCG